ncbi:hypothetical protein DID76_01740 [Candidatus Marinamargulisbacteria bacterium SCGC AG-414-C22]|nr:hypothetical protein DID76_01740 [Candidatus Marinamargulisbacteria bacterium SCGC AG-414-C22]
MNETKYICNELSKIEQKECFEKHFENVSGYGLSAKDKQQFDGDSKSLVYGDIDFDGFAAILDKVEISDDSIFYDLGSGIGKALMTAALKHPFCVLCGVEILPGLHQKSIEILNKFTSSFNGKDIKLPTFQIENKCILDVNMTDADIVYISSTCFDEDFMGSICEKLTNLKIGSYIITLTKHFKDDSLKILYQGQQKMGWGTPTVFIHEKVA